jgi:hypothetical protein
MNKLCKVFGHKWEGQFPEQGCKRKNCSAWRTAYIKKYPEFGEPASGWKVHEELKFKKLK